MKCSAISALIAAVVLVASSGAHGAVAVSDCDCPAYCVHGIPVEDLFSGIQEPKADDSRPEAVVQLATADNGAWPTKLPDQGEPSELAPVPEPVSIVIWTVAGGLGAGAALAARRKRHQARHRWPEESRRAIFDVIEGKRRASSSHLEL